LCDLVVAVCSDAGIGPRDLRAVGVASTGPLDLAAGTVEGPANLPGVERVRLRDPVADLVESGAVYVHNDANAGVIGERYFTDPNPDDMVYLTVSSGIGAGVCVDGHVLRGWDGNAGEIGHMQLDPAGRMTCGCGGSGHWEAYCAGCNVPDYARYLHEEAPIDTALPLNDPGLTTEDVFSLAGEDPLVDRLIDRMAAWNALGVANLVHAYAPLVVAVGGAVALSNEAHVIAPIAERIDDLVFTGVPEVRATVLDEDVVVRGAVASAITGGTGER
jgi:glucokinase